MTPEERANGIVDRVLEEGWHGSKLRTAITLAIREAYETSAKIADEAAKEAGDPYCCVPWCETIASRIRARAVSDGKDG